MDSFDEWVKSAQNPCFQDWGEKAAALGASWDSFRRNKQELVNDFVQGGIPLLAARDLVDLASEEVKRSAAPMSIFWDLENMPIPSGVSGRDIASTLKSILAPHGDLVQFRGYASIGLGLIPQEKRSDLQLSGCHLVDCPHHGRKEVADKMIIVDALKYAYENPQGATLCFITGDVDYAYLLAVLQRPAWRTIVISRGTMQSMLHVNCDMKMRWETDILQPIYESSSSPTLQEPSEATISENGTAVRPKLDDQFDPLTSDDAWRDDVEFLRNVIKQEGRRFGTTTPYKSQVGNILRQTNPARFPHREAIKAFFAQAIEKGVIAESGDGAFKTLRINYSGNSQNPWLVVSTNPPMAVTDLPAKVLRASETAPYVLFLPKINYPSGFQPPPRTFVQPAGDFLLLMYQTYGEVLKSANSLPFLRSGTLVDFRSLGRNVCLQCGTELLPDADHVNAGSMFCSTECDAWSDTDKETKNDAVKLVLESLNYFADHDDIDIDTDILANAIFVHNPEKCSSQKLARVWIKQAELSEAVSSAKQPGTPSRLLSLQSQADDAQDVLPPDDLDTSAEEKFIYDLLWEDTNAGLNRKTVNRMLEDKFEHMNTRLFRAKVFANAQKKGTFYVARGAFAQTVGLTQEQADVALKNLMNGLQDKEGGIPATKSIHREICITAKDTSRNIIGLPLLRALSMEHDPRVETKQSNRSSDESSQSTTTSSEHQKPTRSTNLLIDSSGKGVTRNLHVAGYGFGTNRFEILSMFEKHAKLISVVPKANGIFMFVNTASKKDAINARLALHGETLNGGIMKVNFAKEYA